MFFFIFWAETENLVQRQRLGFKDSNECVLSYYDKSPRHMGLDEVPEQSVSVWVQWGERKWFLQPNGFWPQARSLALEICTPVARSAPSILQHCAFFPTLQLLPRWRPHKSCAGGCCRALQLQSWAGGVSPHSGFVLSDILEKKVFSGLFHTRSYHLCPWGSHPCCPSALGRNCFGVI